MDTERAPFMHHPSHKGCCLQWRAGDTTGDPITVERPFTLCPNCFPGYGKTQTVCDRPAMLEGDWSQQQNAPDLRWWDLAKALGADHEVEHGRTCTRWVRHTLTLNGRFVLWELTGEELASETLEAQEGRLNRHARILVQHVFRVPGLAAFPQRPLAVKCYAREVCDSGPGSCGKVQMVYSCCEQPERDVTIDRSEYRGNCPRCKGPIKVSTLPNPPNVHDDQATRDRQPPVG